MDNKEDLDNVVDLNQRRTIHLRRTLDPSKDADLSARLARIQRSLARVNTLLETLKKMTEQKNETPK